MSIEDQIRDGLRRYIVQFVDQLCEGVSDWYDTSRVAGDEEEGYWVWPETTINYWVHPDVEPRRGIPNFRTFRSDASWDHLVRELDRLIGQGKI